MTPVEKLTLESTAALCDTASGLLKDIAAIYELLSVHLPNLSDGDRAQLHSEHKLRVENAAKLKDNAKNLRSIAAPSG